jgi:putative ABC transport system permease protein
MAETNSGIGDDVVSIVRASPEAAPAAGGTVSTSEAVMIIGAQRNNDKEQALVNVIVRGVRTPDSFTLRPYLRVTEGRPFTPGGNEVIVGKGLIGRIRGLSLNQDFEMKANRIVRVVGVFDTDGSSFDSEVWGDLETMRSMFGRTGSVSSVTLKLKDRDQLETMKARIEADPRIGLEVKRESTYYEELSEGLALFFRVLGLVIAIIFSGGAMIGAMITMYAQVAQRGREVGTLRALGFPRFTVLMSFLLESILLSVGGGLIGLGGAMLLGFWELSTVSFASFSEIVFRLTPTPGILIGSLAFASSMGIVGGFLPALRAAKVSPVEAMRG